jgi:hypothetical protein
MFTNNRTIAERQYIGERPIEIMTAPGGTWTPTEALVSARGLFSYVIFFCFMYWEG